MIRCSGTDSIEGISEDKLGIKLWTYASVRMRLSWKYIAQTLLITRLNCF